MGQIYKQTLRDKAPRAADFSIHGPIVVGQTQTELTFWAQKIPEQFLVRGLVSLAKAFAQKRSFHTIVVHTGVTDPTSVFSRFLISSDVDQHEYLDMFRVLPRRNSRDPIRLVIFNELANPKFSRFMDDVPVTEFRTPENTNKIRGFFARYRRSVARASSSWHRIYQKSLGLAPTLSEYRIFLPGTPLEKVVHRYTALFNAASSIETNPSIISTNQAGSVLRFVAGNKLSENYPKIYLGDAHSSRFDMHFTDAIDPRKGVAYCSTKQGSGNVLSWASLSRYREQTQLRWLSTFHHFSFVMNAARDRDDAIYQRHRAASDLLRESLNALIGSFATLGAALEAQKVFDGSPEYKGMLELYQCFEWLPLDTSIHAGAALTMNRLINWLARKQVPPERAHEAHHILWRHLLNEPLDANQAACEAVQLRAQIWMKAHFPKHYLGIAEMLGKIFRVDYSLEPDDYEFDRLAGLEKPDNIAQSWTHSAYREYLYSDSFEELIDLMMRSIFFVNFKNPKRIKEMPKGSATIFELRREPDVQALKTAIAASPWAYYGRTYLGRRLYNPDYWTGILRKEMRLR